MPMQMLPMGKRTMNDIWSTSQRMIEQSQRLIEQTRQRILESALKVESSRRLLNGGVEVVEPPVPFGALWRNGE